MEANVRHDKTDKATNASKTFKDWKVLGADLVNVLNVILAAQHVED